MPKKTCTTCGSKKPLFGKSYAGLALGFGERVSPTHYPGDGATDYLCKSCAQKVEVTCKDHGVVTGNVRAKAPVCPKCREEYRQFGAPPSGYSSIVAFDCETERGPQGAWGDESGQVQKILSDHPCSCGGEWKLVEGNSPMPSGIADNGYRCSSCGIGKWFRFRLWETDAPFPKAR